jgi:hypothetical protein
MTCECKLSVSEDKEKQLYDFLLTLPQPPLSCIQLLPYGFHYTVLTENGGLKIATLYCKK